MAMPKISQGESVSELQSLIVHAEELNQSVDWWNTAMIWALVFAAIAAIAVVVTTRLALVRSKQLSDTQDKISRLKDAEIKAAQDGFDLDLTHAKTDLNNAKSELTGKQTELEKEQQKTANAQKEAAEAQYKWNQALANHTFTWRQLDNSVVPLFNNIPKQKAEILYKKGDGEAYMFSMDLARALGERGPKWDIVGPTPTDSPDGAPPLMDILLIVRSRPDPMQLIADSQETKPKMPINLVMRLARIHGMGVDPALPDGFFKIIVGERVGPE